ncbi:MAG: DUF2721 domain-containing protein [Beijerinckiaceae bacterium]
MPEFLSQIASNASVEELGKVMVRATAPVFLLSAVAAYISVLTTRLSRIVDRIRVLNRISETDHDRRFLRSDVPRMKRRAELIHRAIRFSLISAISTSLIVAFMFGGAFVGLRHEWAAALLFVFAQVMFISSLVSFAMELRISMSDYDNYE